MYKVAPEHQAVLRSEYAVNPAGGNEQGLPGADGDPVTGAHLISKEYLILIG